MPLRKKLVEYPCEATTLPDDVGSDALQGHLTAQDADFSAFAEHSEAFSRFEAKFFSNGHRKHDSAALA